MNSPNQELAQQIFDKYKLQQDQRWKNFHEILFRYRQEYGANVEELSKGLMCSRQRLYDFFNEPQSGLPNIVPPTLLTLWELLTSEESEYWAKLKPKFRHNRKLLKQSGSDSLLESLGFQPQGQLEARNQIKVDNPQVHRVISRLNSNWFQDEKARTDAATEVLGLILKRGRCTNRRELTYLSDQQSIEQWPEKSLGAKENHRAVEKYKAVIRSAMDSGKQKFVEEELFELYQSINEHEDLNVRMPNNIHIINCEFRRLSSSIDSVDSETRKAFLEAEKQLNSRFNSSRNIELASLNPVIEVAITCNFSYGKQAHKNVIWRYASTGDHLQNMRAAVEDGIGYPFEYRDISTMSIAGIERSLMRTEVTLIDSQKDVEGIYQGWWVDHNMVLGLLRAMVDAVKRWLAEQNRSTNVEKYFEAFQQRAEVAEELSIGRASFYSSTPGLNYAILDSCVKNIQATTRSLAQEARKDTYARENVSFLHKATHIAQMTQMHISLLEGNVNQASGLFDKAHEVVLNGASGVKSDSIDNVLVLNASSCVMFYYLMNGDSAFIEDRQWREDRLFSIAANARKIRAYIEEKSCINSDAYLHASQFWGTVGYLEFYCATSKRDVPFLEKAVSNLLAAAHYAFRIGNTKRAIHWLAYVSRVYCRLDNLERAQYYLRLSLELSARSSMEPLGDSEPLMTYPELANTVYNIGSDLIENQKEWLEDASPERTWAMINVSISEGEIEMLRGNYQKAMDHFWDSLEISIETGFSRLSADSVYNMYRASIHIGTKGENRVFNEYSSGEPVGPLGDWRRNRFTENLFRFFYSLEEEIEWSAISTKLSDLSQKIWNNWAQAQSSLAPKKDSGREHPFSALIREGSFLKTLDKST